MAKYLHYLKKLNSSYHRSHHTVVALCDVATEFNEKYTHLLLVKADSLEYTEHELIHELSNLFSKTDHEVF